jgi:hypothetical protein
MMVLVMYPDGATELVRPPVLQHLIATRNIVKFRRESGWAVVGVDPLRTPRHEHYQGEDRRGRILVH